MGLLIFFAFRYQFQFANYAYSLRSEGKETGKALIVVQAVVMSLMVIVLNSLLRITVLID